MYGRGPYMRRRGFPLLFPMGGFGMGMGMGGSLLGDLAAGGIGYLMGRQSAQQASQYQAPQYQPPQAPQYQAPQYQPPANQQVPTATGGVEEQALAPVGVALAPPVDHHPGLRQREGQEDADGKQGDRGSVWPPKAT